MGWSWRRLPFSCLVCFWSFSTWPEAEDNEVIKICGSGPWSVFVSQSGKVHISGQGVDGIITLQGWIGGTRVVSTSHTQNKTVTSHLCPGEEVRTAQRRSGTSCFSTVAEFLLSLCTYGSGKLGGRGYGCLEAQQLCHSG